ncbi:MAG: hypothetical protein DGJ47_000564 [Rickettsiaceae bacterium]
MNDQQKAVEEIEEAKDFKYLAMSELEGMSTWHLHHGNNTPFSLYFFENHQSYLDFDPQDCFAD